jgi:cyclic beta-1,2-glucan synthetase
LKDFMPICHLMGDINRAQEYEKTAEKIAENIEKHAWDGEWYLRAFFDNGEPLGSRQNDECRIDSISQSWSVLSKAGNKERTYKAMDSLYRYLVQEEHRLIMLLTPPFDKSKPDPGYIKGYLPGIRENGGQYTHAAVWTVMAFANLGMKETAYKLYNMINPITHAQNYSDAMLYKQEPYVMCADVYSKFPYAGRGGWSWYTGSASWMYQAGIEYILGIKREQDKLYVRPVIPAEWKQFSFTYKFGKTRYLIDVFNPNGKGPQNIEIMMDGKKIDGDSIQMKDDSKEHFVMVTLN